MTDAATAEQPAPIAPRAAPTTLGVDIGGTTIKASVLDDAGALVAEQVRSPTPRTAAPEAVIEVIAKLVASLPPFQRLSVGFPGVVKGGRVVTAPNLGTAYWEGFELIEALAVRFGTPVRILNDAAVQGLGVVEDQGLACVLTLGTGIGCAVFRNRRLLLPLELGQHRARKGLTYDQYVGQAALVKKGPERWNKRVRRTIEKVTSLTSCDVLYIGGGNARKLAFEAPPHVRIVSNTAGITGGVRLWEPALDELFDGIPQAQWPDA